MPAAQTAAFKKAVEDSRKLKAKPSDTELLEVYLPIDYRWQTLTNDLSQLYGLFKQGTQDPPFADTKAPGMFELKVRVSR